MVIRVVFTPRGCTISPNYSYIPNFWCQISSATPSFFPVTVMRCMPGSISPQRKKGKKSAVGLLPFEWPERARVCRSGPHGPRSKNIVETEGGRPPFMFQWTTRSLHGPNPGAIPPHTSTTTTHTAPFPPPRMYHLLLFLGEYRAG